MERCVDVAGEGHDIVMRVDGKKTASFKLTSSITAEDLYEAFDYHVGNRYRMGEVELGTVPEHTLAPFVGLVREIVEGLNLIECTKDESAKS